MSATPTISDLALAALATLMMAVRIQGEEQLLVAAMPQYPAYAAHTKRLIPFIFQHASAFRSHRITGASYDRP